MGEHPSITKEAYNKSWYQVSDFLNNFTSLGKNALMNRSRSYKAAISVLRKVDTDIRKYIEQQKRVVKQINRAKKKMELAPFKQGVDDFLNLQEAILKILKPEARAEFNNILQHVKHELFRNPKAKRIPFNPHESVQRVLQSISDAGMVAGGPGFDPTVAPFDWKTRAQATFDEQEKARKKKEKESKQRQQQQRKAEAINEFVKNGGMFDWYFSGRHYKNLQEGDELYGALDNIFNTIEAIYQNNDQTYSELHAHYAKGDPKAYLDTLASLEKQTATATASIWSDYNKHLAPLAEQENVSLNPVSETAPSSEQGADLPQVFDAGEPQAGVQAEPDTSQRREPQSVQMNADSDMHKKIVDTIYGGHYDDAIELIKQEYSYDLSYYIGFYGGGISQDKIEEIMHETFYEALRMLPNIANNIGDGKRFNVLGWLKTIAATKIPAQNSQPAKHVEPVVQSPSAPVTPAVAEPAAAEPVAQPVVEPAEPAAETAKPAPQPKASKAPKAKAPAGLPRKKKVKVESVEQALEQITKTAMDGNPYAVAVEILKFAEEIEDVDEELADQLTAIAESVING